MKQKGPRTVFRLLAFLLLALALAETPLSAGLVFAEEQTRTIQRSRELLSGDLPARHALPERASVEVSAGAGFHTAASQVSGGSDELAPVLPGSARLAGENAAAWVPSAWNRSVTAPTERASARDPPLAA